MQLIDAVGQSDEKSGKWNWPANSMREMLQVGTQNKHTNSTLSLQAKLALLSAAASTPFVTQILQETSARESCG